MLHTSETQAAGMTRKNNLHNRWVEDQGRARFPEHPWKAIALVLDPVATTARRCYALSTAPSGTRSCSTYFHSAMSSFRASATMPFRLERLVPPRT